MLKLFGINFAYQDKFHKVFQLLRVAQMIAKPALNIHYNSCHSSVQVWEIFNYEEYRMWNSITSNFFNETNINQEKKLSVPKKKV